MSANASAPPASSAVTRKTRSRTPVAVPPAAYVGVLRLRPAPTVPIVTSAAQGVLLPGGRSFRVSGWQGGGLSSCEDSAADSTGRWFAYTNTDRQLRVVDTRNGKVWSLGQGCGPVWGPGGLAYMSTDNEGDPNGQYHARVVVRSTPLARAQVWTGDEMRPLMWVGHRLLYDNSLEWGRRPTLELASGPGLGRPIPVGARPGVALWRPLAVSPDNSRVLLEADVTGASGAHLYPRDLELVDTHTRRVLSTLRPTGFASVRSAVWLGREIVVSNQTDDATDNRPNPSLATLTTDDNTLRVRRIVTTTAARGANPEFDWYDSLQGIRDGQLAAVHHQQNGATLVTCWVVRLQCTATVRLY